LRQGRIDVGFIRLPIDETSPSSRRSGASIRRFQSRSTP
jgi:hypothetical protein